MYVHYFLRLLKITNFVLQKQHIRLPKGCRSYITIPRTTASR